MCFAQVDCLPEVLREEPGDNSVQLVGREADQDGYRKELLLD